MGAKLRQKDGSYWCVVHFQGKRKWKKIGTDKRVAQKVVHRVNAQIAIGEFSMEAERRGRTVEQALTEWYDAYLPTFSPSFVQLAKGNIDRHLVPAFGSLQLSELQEQHLLEFIAAKTVRTKRPLKAATLTNILSVLRRVATLAVEQGELSRNPARSLGKLLAKVKRQRSEEVEHVSSLTREEVATLLDVAQEREPGFHPLLLFLLSTGCRKGEALALKWQDIDFADSRLMIRRSLVRGQMGPLKSGKARFVVLCPALAAGLRDLLVQPRTEGLKRRWPEVPTWSSAPRLEARSTNAM